MGGEGNETEWRSFISSEQPRPTSRVSLPVEEETGRPVVDPWSSSADPSSQHILASDFVMLERWARELVFARPFLRSTVLPVWDQVMATLLIKLETKYDIRPEQFLDDVDPSEAEFARRLGVVEPPSLVGPLRSLDPKDLLASPRGSSSASIIPEGRVLTADDPIHPSLRKDVGRDESSVWYHLFIIWPHAMPYHREIAREIQNPRGGLSVVRSVNVELVSRETLKRFLAAVYGFMLQKDTSTNHAPADALDHIDEDFFVGSRATRQEWRRSLDNEVLMEQLETFYRKHFLDGKLAYILNWANGKSAASSSGKNSGRSTLQELSNEDPRVEVQQRAEEDYSAGPLRLKLLLVRDPRPEPRLYGQEVWTVLGNRRAIDLKWRLRLRFNPADPASMAVTQLHCVHATDNRKELLQVARRLEREFLQFAWRTKGKGSPSFVVGGDGVAALVSFVQSLEQKNAPNEDIDVGAGVDEVLTHRERTTRTAGASRVVFSAHTAAAVRGGSQSSRGTSAAARYEALLRTVFSFVTACEPNLVPIKIEVLSLFPTVVLRGGDVNNLRDIDLMVGDVDAVVTCILVSAGGSMAATESARAGGARLMIQMVSQSSKDVVLSFARTSENDEKLILHFWANYTYAPSDLDVFRLDRNPPWEVVPDRLAKKLSRLGFSFRALEIKEECALRLVALRSSVRRAEGTYFKSLKVHHVEWMGSHGCHQRLLEDHPMVENYLPPERLDTPAAGNEDDFHFSDGNLNADCSTGAGPLHQQVHDQEVVPHQTSATNSFLVFAVLLKTSRTATMEVIVNALAETPHIRILRRQVISRFRDAAGRGVILVDEQSSRSSTSSRERGRVVAESSGTDDTRPGKNYLHDEHDHDAPPLHHMIVVIQIVSVVTRWEAGDLLKAALGSVHAVSEEVQAHVVRHPDQVDALLDTAGMPSSAEYFFGSKKPHKIDFGRSGSDGAFLETHNFAAPPFVVPYFVDIRDFVTRRHAGRRMNRDVPGEHDIREQGGRENHVRSRGKCVLDGGGRASGMMVSPSMFDPPQFLLASVPVTALRIRCAVSVPQRSCRQRLGVVSLAESPHAALSTGSDPGYYAEYVKRGRDQGHLVDHQTLARFRRMMRRFGGDAKWYPECRIPTRTTGETLVHGNTSTSSVVDRDRMAGAAPAVLVQEKVVPQVGGDGTSAALFDRFAQYRYRTSNRRLAQLSPVCAYILVNSELEIVDGAHRAAILYANTVFRDSRGVADPGAGAGVAGEANEKLRRVNVVVLAPIVSALDVSDSVKILARYGQENEESSGGKSQIWDDLQAKVYV